MQKNYYGEFGNVSVNDNPKVKEGEIRRERTLGAALSLSLVSPAE